MLKNFSNRRIAGNVLACLILFVGGRADAGRAPGVVSVSDEGRVVFRVDLEPYSIASGLPEGTEAVTVPGFINRGEPGEPATPTRQFLLALPPSGAYRVTWRVLESKPLGTRRLAPNPFPAGIRDDDLGPLTAERYAFDADIYNAYRNPPIVEPREPAFIRRTRVLPLLVNPLSYDPQSGRAVLATSIEVTVTFEGGGAPVGRTPAPESRLWNSVFARMFVNSEQAAAWQVPRAAAPAPRAAAQGTCVKLKVFETGVHRVVASTAIGAGFPAGRSISGLHLFRRGYDEDTFVAGVADVAFTVEEGTAGTAGVFDGDDALVFYALGIRDDAERDDSIRKYADYNVYWLGAGPGPMMGTRAVPPGFVGADTASASFTANDHVELDFYFNETAPVGIDDYYYANHGSLAGPVDQSFEVGAIKPGTSLALRAELLGDRYRAPRAISLSLVNSLGTTVLQPSLSIPNKARVEFQAQVPAANVAAENAFRVARPDASRGGVEVLLNWVEISYESLYRARGNVLEFDSALLSGDTSVVVTGLDDPDVWLLDVSDPDAPIRYEIGPGHFVPAAGGGLALSFRDNIAARRDYVVTPLARMTEVSADNIEADVPSTLVGGPAEGGVDVLVVAHASFLSRMQQWVTYRRAQGYRVLMVDVADVYDEFNNGVPHARAIDRFVRHFFELGNASALLLVGDSSEDNKNVEPLSAPNFVPTHSWTDHVGALNEDEVVTTDKRYVKLPGPTGVVDRYPDMIVGRLPVGSDSELQRVLAKIFAFEKPRATDFWRKRMIVVADDAYSEGNSTFGGAEFCFTGTEIPFETGQETFADIIEASPPAGYDVVRFFLDDYTAAIHQQSCVPKVAAVNYVRANVTPLLMNELGQGATLVTIQAHMNRTLVTHEKLLSTESGSTLDGVGRDHLRMENRDRPYIIFGMGCHFSDYALHKELEPRRVVNNSPNGDAFAEQLLFANNSGAVSTYGSSGFEYLGQTNAFMTTTARVWFYESPYDTTVNQTQAQWVFGQLMFLVENHMAFAQANPVERYHILGDPLLNIDAGPPAFDVTVNGAPFQSGAVVTSGGEGDTVRVGAVVTDENAIRDFKLTIDGQDRSGDLSVEQLLDTQLGSGRQYRLEFAHKLRPRTYDMVLNAYQAPDTSGDYQMAAEFVMRVESRVTLTVNGRVVESGAVIPAKSDYLVEVALPVFIPGDSVYVKIDDTVVPDAVLSHPAPDDSTTWLIRFTRTLSEGSHEILIHAGSANEFRFSLTVSSDTGLRHVINYPNPFKDTTSFVFTNDVEISDGRVDIFTVTGKRVRRLEIPSTSTQPGQNTVFWDGRDQSGGTIANGVYLYVITVTQRGSSSTTRGKLARIE